MSKFFLVLFGSLCLIGCGTSPDVHKDRPSPHDALYLHLLQGNTAAVYRDAVQIYKRAGFEIPSRLLLQLQSWETPLSYYDREGNRIVLSSMVTAEETQLYWKMWSEVASDGEWIPELAFSGQEDMRNTANFAILGILAHELGHAIQDYYQIAGLTRNEEELFADRCAVAFMVEIAEKPELNDLVQRYRNAVVGSLGDAVPDGKRATIPGGASLDSWCHTNGLPEDTGAYVSLQLARQDRLFSDAGESSSLKNLLRDRCQPAWEAHLSRRKMEGANRALHTRAKVPMVSQPNVVTGFTPEGDVLGAMIPDNRRMVMLFGYGPEADPVAVPQMRAQAIPAGRIGSVAFVSTTDYYVTIENDDGTVSGYRAQYEASEIKVTDLYLPNGIEPGATISLSPDGLLYLFSVRTNDDGDRVYRFECPFDNDTAAAPLEFPVPADASSAWDGSPGEAGIAVSALAPYQDGYLFLDPERVAVRYATIEGVVTLAGERRDTRDGIGRIARLMNPTDLRVLENGTIQILDRWSIPDGSKIKNVGYLRDLRLR